MSIISLLFCVLISHVIVQRTSDIKIHAKKRKLWISPSLYNKKALDGIWLKNSVRQDVGLN